MVTSVNKGFENFAKLMNQGPVLLGITFDSSCRDLDEDQYVGDSRTGNFCQINIVEVITGFKDFIKI